MDQDLKKEVEISDVRNCKEEMTEIAEGDDDCECAFEGGMMKYILLVGIWIL